jgi:uncharacterized repeat protein (TIGR02543 family)
MPDYFSKEGYIFGGWYLDKALTTPFDISTGLKGRVNLFVKWVLINEQTQNPFFSLKGKFTTQEDMDILRYFNKRIEPIGWSRDGLFAYRTEWHDYSKSEMGNALVIFNVVTDEEIAINRIVTDSSSPNFQFPNDEEITKKRQEWRETLTKHNIIMGGDERSFHSASFYNISASGQDDPREYHVFRDSDFGCWFDSELLNDELIDWKLIVEINSKQKIVSSGRESADILLNKYISRYYKSPYENRIVIIGVDVEHGFAGEMSYDLQLYGCHLSVGFE